MTANNLVSEKLYEKYIEPTKKKREHFIGIEIEMPIVNLDKKAVDFSVVHQITDEFMRHFRFNVVGRDEDGHIYSAYDEACGDFLSYDCSYNNLELSFGREHNLHILWKRFSLYYQFLQEQFHRYHYTLTGMGVNPYRIYNHLVPIPNERYRMLYHHLCSYKNYDLPMFFHPYPEYGMFSSASQVQLDVEYGELLMTLRAFSKLEPLKAILFSNSVLLDEHEKLLCCRDMFWENSTHGINPHNIGMYECRLEKEEDLLSYIESTSIYCVERGGKYINFPPVNIMEYFTLPYVEGEYYDKGTYKKIHVKPHITDIQYLRTFKFEDLTFRGTIEFRSVCCQPVRDTMTVAAFHAGLKKRLKELDELLGNDHVIYHNGYTAGELRKLFVYDELPPFLDEASLYHLIEEVLDLAKKGLRDRGYGEEIMLEPLYERVNERTNPAKKMLEQRKSGTEIEKIILDYSQI